MFQRSLLRLALTLCFFAFIASVNAFENPAHAQCESATDAQLVADIYARIKADTKLAPQISHINVVGINLAVKLQGWGDTKKDYDKVVRFVSETPCVRLINVSLFKEAPPSPTDSLRVAEGCAPGTKACGDICIPESDSCNIEGKAGNDE